MRDFRISTTIDAPGERVWAVLVDVERWPEWTASVSRVELLTGAPLGLSGRVRIDQPKLRPAVWTVTLWQPGQRFVWESANPGVRVVAEHAIATRAGGCTVTLAVQFNGLFGSAAGALNRELTTHYLELEANGLKATSEGLE